MNQPMDIKRKAVRALSKGKAPCVVARTFKINYNTVCTWDHRRKKEVKIELPPPPEWMQSGWQSDAHLVNHLGQAMCNPKVSGMVGVHWHPMERDRRKCTRCQGWENRNATGSDE